MQSRSEQATSGSSPSFAALGQSEPHREQVARLLQASQHAWHGGQLLDAVRFAEDGRLQALIDEPAAGMTRVRLPRSGRALRAFLREFQARHGRRAGQFSMAMLVLPLAACSSLGLDGSDAPAPVDPDAPLEGVVIDGYLAGAEVARADGSGDAVVTDDQGRFEGLEGSGAVVASGGIDVATGLPFTGELSAPGQAAVVTPLTTLVQARLAQGVDGDPEAAAAVVAQLGLADAVGNSSLLELDPVATDNLEVYAAGAQVANALSLTSAAGGNAQAVALALAEQGALLNDSAALASALEAADLAADRAADLAEAIVNANAVIADAGDREGVARVQYLVQGEWVDATAAGEMLAGQAGREAIEAAAARAPISGDQGGGSDAPVASLTLDTDALAEGETAELVIEFSAPPAELDAEGLAALLAVSGGELVALEQDPDAPERFVGQFVPDADTAGTAEVVLPGGSFQDADGIPGAGAIARAPFDTRDVGLTVAPLAAPAPGLPEQADFGLEGQAPEAAAGGSVAITLRDAEGDTLTSTAAIDGQGNWQIEGLQLFGLARGQLALELEARDAEGGTVATLDAQGPLLPPFAETPVTAELADQDATALLDVAPNDSLVVAAAGMSDARLSTWVEALDQVAVFEQLEATAANVGVVLDELISADRVDPETLVLDATAMAAEDLQMLAAWLGEAPAGPAQVTGALELSFEIGADMIGRLLAAGDADLQATALLTEMNADQLAALTQADAGALTLIGDLAVRPGVDGNVIADLLPRLDEGQLALQPDGLDADLLATVASALAAEDGPVNYILEGPLVLGADLDEAALQAMLNGLTEVDETDDAAPEPALTVDLTAMDAAQLQRVAELLPTLEGLLPLSLVGEATIDSDLDGSALNELLALVDQAEVSLNADASGMAPPQVWALLDGPELFASIRNLELTADNLFAADLAPLFEADVLERDSTTAVVTDMSPDQLAVLADHLDVLAAVTGELALDAALAPGALEAWLAEPVADTVAVDLAGMTEDQQAMVADAVERVDSLVLADGQELRIDAVGTEDLAVSGPGTLALTGTLTQSLLDNPDLLPGTLDLAAAELAADVSGLALNETSTFVLTPEQTRQLQADGIQGTGTADRIDVDVSGEDFEGGNVPEVGVALELGAGDDEVTFRFGSGADDRSVALSADSVLDFGTGANVLSASEGTVDVSAASLNTAADGDLELRVNSGLTLSADQFQQLLDELGEGSTAALAGAGTVEITGTLTSGQLDLTAFGDNFTAGGLTPPTLALSDMDESVLTGEPPELILPEEGAAVRILLDGEPVSGFEAEEIQAQQVTIYTEGQLEDVLAAIDAGADVQTLTFGVPLQLTASHDLAAAPGLTVTAAGSLQVAAAQTLTLSPAQAAELTVNGDGTALVRPVEDGALPAAMTDGLTSGSRILQLQDPLQVDGRDADMAALTSVQLLDGRLTLAAGQAHGLVADGEGGTLQLTGLAGPVGPDLDAVQVGTLELELDSDTLFASELAADVSTLVIDAADAGAEAPVIELAAAGEQLPPLQVAAGVTAWMTAAQAEGLQASGAGTLGVHGLEGAADVSLAELQAGRLVVELETGAVDSLTGDLGAAEVVLIGSGSVRVQPGLDWQDASFLYEQGATPELVFGAELSASELEALLTEADIDPGIGRVVDAADMDAAQLAAVLAAGDGVDRVSDLTLDADLSAQALSDWLQLDALDLDSLQLQTADMSAEQLAAVTTALGSELNQADSPEALGAALQVLQPLAEADSPLASWAGLSGRIQQALQEDLLASRPDAGFDVAALLSGEASDQAAVWTGLIDLHASLDEALVAVNSEALATALQPRELTVDELEEVVSAYRALPEQAQLGDGRQQDLAQLDARLGPLLDGDVPEGATDHLQGLLASLTTELSETYGGLANLQVVKVTTPIVPGSVGNFSGGHNPTVHYSSVDHAIVRSDGTLFMPHVAASTHDFDGVFEFDELIALRTEAELSRALSHGFFQHDLGHEDPDPGLLLVTDRGQLLSAGSTTISMPDELASELSSGVAQVEVADYHRPKVLVRSDDGEMFGWWDETFDGGRTDSLGRQLEHMSEAGISHIFSTGDTGSGNLVAISDDGQAFNWGRQLPFDPEDLTAVGPGAEILDVASSRGGASNGGQPFTVLRADGAIESNIPLTLMNFRAAIPTTRWDDGERVDYTIPPRIFGGSSSYGVATDESTFDYSQPNVQVGEPPYSDPDSWVFAGRSAVVSGTQESYLEQLFGERALLATNPIQFEQRHYRRDPDRDDAPFTVENPLLTSGFVQIAGGGRSLMALDQDGAVQPIGNHLGNNRERFESGVIRNVEDLRFDDLDLDGGVAEVLSLFGSRNAHQRDYAALKDDGELVFWRGQDAFFAGSDEVADLLASGNREFIDLQFGDYRNNRDWNDVTVSVLRDDDSVVTYELVNTASGVHHRTRTVETVDTTELNEVLAERGPFTEIVETYTSVGVALHESGEVTLWNVPTGDPVTELTHFDGLRFERGYGETFRDVVAGDDFVGIEGSMLVRENGSLVPLPVASAARDGSSLVSMRSPGQREEVLEQLATSADDTLGDVAALTGELNAGFEALLLEELNTGNTAFQLGDAPQTLLLTAIDSALQDALATVAERDDLDYEAFLEQWTSALLDQRPADGFASLEQAVAAATPTVVSLVALAELGEQVLAQVNDAIADEAPAALWEALDSQLRDGLAAEALGLEAHQSVFSGRMDGVTTVVELGDLLDELDGFLAMDGVSGSQDAAAFLAERLLAAAPAEGFDVAADISGALTAELAGLQTLVTTGLDQQTLAQDQGTSWNGLLYNVMLPSADVLDVLADGSQALQAHRDFVAAGQAPLPGLAAAAAQQDLVADVEAFVAEDVFQDTFISELLAWHVVALEDAPFQSLDALLDTTRQAAEEIVQVAEAAATVDEAVAGADTAAALAPVLDPAADTRTALEQGEAALGSYAGYFDEYQWAFASMEPAAALDLLVRGVDSLVALDAVDGDALAFLAELLDEAGPADGYAGLVDLQQVLAPILPDLEALVVAGSAARQALVDADDADELAAVLGRAAEARAPLEAGATILDEHETFQADDTQTPLSSLVAAQGLRQLLTVEDSLLDVDGMELAGLRELIASETIARLGELPDAVADLAAAVADIADEALLPLAELAAALPGVLQAVQTEADARDLLADIRPVLEDGQALLARNASLEPALEPLLPLTDLADANTALADVAARDTVTAAAVDDFVANLLLSAGEWPQSSEALADALPPAAEAAALAEELVTGINNQDLAATRAALDDLALLAAGLGLPALGAAAIEAVQDAADALPEAEQQEALEALSGQAPGEDWTLAQVLDGTLLDRALNTFQDPDAVFVPQQFEVENLLGDEVTVTIDDLVEQDAWHLLAAEPTRAQTAALVLSNAADAQGEDLLLELRIVDLNSGTVLAGRGLETAPTALDPDVREPVEELVPAPGAEPFIYIGQAADDGLSLTLTQYRADVDIGPNPEAVDERVLELPEDHPVWSPNDVGAWLPASEEGPDYLMLQSFNLVGQWPELLAFFGDGAGQPVPIGGMEPGDNTFLQVLDAFRADDSLWMHFSAFSELPMPGQELPEYVRFVPLEGGSQLMAEAVTEDAYLDARTQALELDTLLPIGDRVVDLQEALGDADVRLDNSWSVEALEDGRTLIRAEVLPDGGQPLGHEHWLLYDSEGDLLAERAFEQDDAALVRSLQGADGNLYAQQLAAGPDAQDFRQADPVTLYRIPPSALETLLADDGGSLTDVAGVEALRTLSLDALTDGAVTAPGPEAELVQLQAWYEPANGGAAMGVADQRGPGDAEAAASYWVEYADGATPTARTLPGTFEQLQHLADVDADGLLLQMADAQGSWAARFDLEAEAFTGLPMALLEALRQDDPLQAGLAQADGLIDPQAVELDALPDDVLAWSLRDPVQAGTQTGTEQVLIFDVLFEDGHLGSALVGAEGSRSVVIEPDGLRLQSDGSLDQASGAAVVEVTREMLFTTGQVEREDDMTTVVVNALELEAGDSLAQQVYRVNFEQTDPDAPRELSVTSESGFELELPHGGLSQLGLSEFGYIETATGLLPASEQDDVLGLAFRTHDPAVAAPTALQGVLLAGADGDGPLTPIEGRNTLDLRQGPPLQPDGLAALSRDPDLGSSEPLEVVFAALDGSLLEATIEPDVLLGELDDVNPALLQVNVLDYVIRDAQGEQASFLFALEAQAAAGEPEQLHLVRAEAELHGDGPLALEAAGHSMVAGGLDPALFDLAALPDAGLVPRDHDGQLYLRYLDPQQDSAYLVLDEDMDPVAGGLDARADLLQARSDYFGLPLEPEAFIRTGELDFASLQGDDLSVWLAEGVFEYAPEFMSPVIASFDPDLVQMVTGSDGDDLLAAGSQPVTLRGGAGDDSYQLDGFGADPGNSYTLLFEADPDLNGNNTVSGFTVGATADGGDVIGFEGLNALSLFGQDLQQVEDADALTLGADTGLVAFTTRQTEDTVQALLDELDGDRQLMVLTELESDPDAVGLYVLSGGEPGERGAIEQTASLDGLSAGALGVEALDENLRDFNAV